MVVDGNYYGKMTVAKAYEVLALPGGRGVARVIIAPPAKKLTSPSHLRELRGQLCDANGNTAYRSPSAGALGVKPTGART